MKSKSSGGSNGEVKECPLNSVGVVTKTTKTRKKRGRRKKNDTSNPKDVQGLGLYTSGIWKKNLMEDFPYFQFNPNECRRVEDVPCGLENLGATCYMNAQLQVLYFNKSFREALFRWMPCDDNERWSQITKHLQNLFAGLRLSRRRALNPTRFVNALNLQTGIQQDAQEFNKLLMEQLEIVFKKSSVLSVRDFIPKHFCGTLKYTVTCDVCKNESTRLESFYELRLQIETGHNIESCIRDYFRSEYFRDGNKYMCDVCKTKQNAVRRTNIVTLPEVLNLQLMRFVYDMQTFQKKKLMCKIQAPKKIKIPVLKGKKIKHVGYELTARLFHRGATANSGHYVAKVIDSKDRWWLCDDEVVALAEDEDENEESTTASTITTKGKKRTKTRRGKIKKKKKMDRQKNKISSNGEIYMVVYRKMDGKSKKMKDPLPEKNVLETVQKDNELFQEEIQRFERSKEKFVHDVEIRKQNCKKAFVDLELKDAKNTKYRWVPTEWLRAYVRHWSAKPENDACFFFLSLSLSLSLSHTHTHTHTGT